MTEPAQPQPTFGPLLSLLAVTAFVVGGCIHYQTPMLSAIAEECR